MSRVSRGRARLWGRALTFSPEELNQKKNNVQSMGKCCPKGWEQEMDGFIPRVPQPGSQCLWASGSHRCREGCCLLRGGGHSLRQSVRGCQEQRWLRACAVFLPLSVLFSFSLFLLLIFIMDLVKGVTYSFVTTAVSHPALTIYFSLEATTFNSF